MIRVVSMTLAALACLAMACAPPVVSPAIPSITREDTMVDSEPGIRIAVRRVAMTGDAGGAPVLLIHGAGGGGIASFDVAVPGYSLAEDLARAGHPAYLVDVRGWGHSTRPPALDQPPDAN